MIRSLSISQLLLGTTTVLLLQHTDCGMVRITDDSFRQMVEDRTGARPDWPVGAFSDLDQHVRESIGRVMSSPFLQARTSVRGFIFDVDTERVREVPPDQDPGLLP